MAMAGGLMLMALMLITCASVLGRTVNGLLHSEVAQSLMPDLASWLLQTGVGPVNGDFELIEAGVAFSIFAFLPICQLTGGHATVDVFTAGLSASRERKLQFVIDTLFALVLVLIATQLFNGMLSKMRSGQTTLLLEFPLWWAYALSIIGATIAAVVAIYIAVVRAQELVRDRSILPHPQSTDHEH